MNSKKGSTGGISFYTTWELSMKNIAVRLDIKAKKRD